MRIDTIHKPVVQYAAILMLVVASVALQAQTLGIPSGGKYQMIAPTPIPVNVSGSPGVGVLKIDLECTGGGTAYIGQINITLRGTDSLGTGWAATSTPYNAKAYLNTANKYNARNDPVNSGAITLLATGGVTVTASSITLNTNDGSASIASGTSKTLWIAFDYPASVVTPGTVSYYIDTIKYGSSAGSTANTFNPSGDPNTTVDVNKYSVTFDSVCLIASAEEKDQGTINVPVIKLTFGNSGDEGVMKQISGFTLQYLGQDINDVASKIVNLYVDTNANGTFDPFADTFVSSATLVAGSPPTVTFGPYTVPTTTVQFTNSPRNYFVVVNVATNATVNNDIGFQLVNPSSTVSFADVVIDGGGSVQGEYYQIGYITDTSTWPNPNYSFNIKAYIPPMPPTVVSIVPGDGATNVSRTTTVTATFSEAMNSSTINDTNFLLEGHLGNPVTPQSVNYDGPSMTATFTLQPGTPLLWGETYTATVTTGVKDFNEGLNMTADRVWTFTTIIAVPPVVNVTSPLDGAVEVSLASTITVTFSKEMDETSTEGAFSLRDSLNALVPGTAGYDVGGGTRTLTFTPSTALDWGETYTARITTAATATDGLAMQSDKVWTFITVQPIYPIVLNTIPANTQVDVSRTAAITATFSKAMDDSTIDETTFLLKDHLNTPVVPLDVAYNSSTRTATFSLPVGTPLSWGEIYAVTITSDVKSADGLFMATDKTWTFTTITANNPTVVNVSPADTMVDVLPSAAVIATFSKPMSASTITTTSFTLYQGTSQIAASTVVYDGPSKTATFTPAAALTPGLQYTASITTAAQDSEGLPLLSTKTWSFTITPRPAVLSSTPASGAQGVATSITITATFSKDVDPSTLTTSTFTVSDEAGNPVGGVVSYSNVAFTATFTPGVSLAYRMYTATITTGVMDANGISMSADYTWSFTTNPALDEPVAASNRIVPGGNDRAVLFIPKPPAGVDDRVTVQVFTTTGKRVATLVDNRPYSQIVSSLPLLWDATNGSGVKLGPGVYFVQIRATNFLRTLKIMVVR